MRRSDWTKGALFSFILFFTLPSVLRAQIMGGISLTDAQWKGGMGFNEFLDYEFDTTVFTKLEGKIAEPHTGLSFGVKADIDNSVGKANNVLGYVGLRRLFLRAASSDMKGKINWNNSEQLPGFKQVSTLKFQSKYKYIDLVYYFKRIPLFLGFGYTSYELPTEIKAYSMHDGNQHYKRVGAYDPDYKVQLYNGVFGFDTFASSVFFDDDNKMQIASKNGFGAFFGTEDRFGIGGSHISPATMQVLRDNNPGFKADDASSNYWLIENDSNIGIQWTKTYQSGSRLALGLGYEFAFIIGDAFTGVASQEDTLELQPTHGLIRQGPIAKMYFRW